MPVVLTPGRLLPDTKFVPTAHERLSACPGPETILQLWSGRGADERPMTMAMSPRKEEEAGIGVEGGAPDWGDRHLDTHTP